MSLIQEIGAYAGLAAIPGLAILSALYFSQARDVRRLREWAGRAPERAAEQASGGRVATQQPTTTQPGAAPAAGAGAEGQPAAQPAAAEPATAGAAAAKPAVAGAPANAVAATGGAAVAAGAAPAATGASAAEAGAVAAAASPAAASAGTATPDEVAAGNSGGTGTVTKPATAGAKAATGAGKPATTGAKPAATGARPASTAAGGTGIRRPGAPRIPSQQTSILKPSSAAPPQEPWYRRLAARLPAARYIALIVAGVLVVGGGAAFGITQLAKEDGTTAPDRAPAAATPPEGEEQVSLRPQNITVTVLNGTQINGLARDTATRLEQLGFMIANTLTATETAQAESVVQFTEEPGASQQAKYVAAKLDISQIEPADQESLDQAGSATVIVVLGADQATPAQ